MYTCHLWFWARTPTRSRWTSSRFGHGCSGDHVRSRCNHGLDMRDPSVWTSRGPMHCGIGAMMLWKVWGIGAHVHRIAHGSGAYCSLRWTSSIVIRSGAERRQKAGVGPKVAWERPSQNVGVACRLSRARAYTAQQIYDLCRKCARMGGGLRQVRQHGEVVGGPRQDPRCPQNHDHRAPTSESLID